jgi:hypothetical protein
MLLFYEVRGRGDAEELAQGKRTERIFCAMTVFILE